MFSYYYVSVLHLCGYSVNGRFSIRVRVRVWYYFIFRDRYMSNGLYKRTPDLGREGLVSFDCWYMCGAEGWNTVHSARHRYAASSRGYSSKLLPSGNI